MLEQALALTREYAMLSPGSTVLCAVSGGADSMCLLHWLSRREGISLHAAHFDHRLRGAESDADAAFVRDWCRENGIPFHLGSADVRATTPRPFCSIWSGAPGSKGWRASRPGGTTWYAPCSPPPGRRSWPTWKNSTSPTGRTAPMPTRLSPAIN